jgi:UDP-N-acetylglucosamine 4,6-dehydratase
MTHLSGASILITGGTGSFGNRFIRRLFEVHDPARVVILSRDELKQSEMRQTLGDDPRLRWFLGDVRDKERLLRAFRGIDVVVHAAALKQVDTAEYNPFEFVKTNVLGSQNVVDAALDSGVGKVLALSTDKASSPINLYGATKLTADKLFIAANSYGAATGTAMSVVRYGNVIASRGSVIPHFQSRIEQGLPLGITDLRMTRFWITLTQAADFVMDCLRDMQGGELYVPRIPSMRITDLVEAMAPGGYPTEVTGIRPGEKLHEEMISVDDSPRTVKQVGRYVVCPTIAKWDFHAIEGDHVPEGFSYRSDTNDQWLTVEDLRSALRYTSA